MHESSSSCILPSISTFGREKSKPQKSMRKHQSSSSCSVGNIYFFGNDSFHHCLQKPSNTKAKKCESHYFGASTDAQFTRHHYLLESNEIIKVASGDFHSLFLTRDKRVIVAGKNKNGQLGLYHFDPIAEPQYLDYVGEERRPCPPVRNVYCGGDYSLIETEDHHIYSFGKNKIGQIGIGDCVNPRVSIPTRISIQQKVTACSSSSSSSSCTMSSKTPGENLPVKLISCGWQSTFILFETEQLYVCGDNSHQCNVHQQQNPNYKPIISPQKKLEKYSFQKIDIPNLYASSLKNHVKNSIQDIQVGLFHTGILMKSGEVWISCPCCCSPIELERRKFKKKSFMDKNGKLIVTEYGDDLLKSFKLMHMAYLSTFLCTHNDVMYVSGVNYCGSLGVGSDDLLAYKRFTESPLLSQIEAEKIYGTNRTIMVTKQGHVYVCGSNCQGELCLDPTTHSCENVNGKACPCGADECFRSCISAPVRVILLENEVNKRRNVKLEMSCGSFHTIAFFKSCETRDMFHFYNQLYSQLVNNEFSDVDINFSTKRVQFHEVLDEEYLSPTKRVKM